MQISVRYYAAASVKALNSIAARNVRNEYEESAFVLALITGARACIAEGPLSQNKDAGLITHERKEAIKPKATLLILITR